MFLYSFSMSQTVLEFPKTPKSANIKSYERATFNCFRVEFKKLHFAEAILVTIVKIKHLKEQIL